MSRTVFDCALTGTIGILTGFAVFVLTWEEQWSIEHFLWILLIVALFATAFEYLRGVIDGSEHPISLPQYVTRLFLLAIFELFITAIHTSLSFNASQLSEVGTAVLGPSLAAHSSAVVNLILMALLWIVIGAAIGAALAFAIGSEKKSTAAAIGLGAGAIGAPAAVLCYVVVTRFAAEVQWMIAKPDEWVQNVQNLHDRIISWWLFPVKIGAGLMLRVYSWHHGTVGLMLASFALIAIVAIVLAVLAANKEQAEMPYLWVLAAPVAIFGAPLIGPSLYQDIRHVGVLLLLVAVVWGVPALLIGLGVPYLREPSRNRKTWAGVAWLASGVMILYAYLVQSAWIALLAAILFTAAVAFWRKGSVEDYWPLVALSIATVVLGITKITVTANFLYIQDISRVLLDEPLSKVSAPAPTEWQSALSRLASSPSWYGRYNPQAKSLIQVETTEQWRKRATEEISSANNVAAEAGEVVDDLQRPAARQAAADAMLLSRLSMLRVRDLPELADGVEKTGSMLDHANEIETKLGQTVRSLQQLRSSQPFFSISGVLSGQTHSEVFGIADAIKRVSSVKQRMDVALAALRAQPLATMQRHLTQLRDRLAQQFELCLTGSFGFWVTLGLLAGWSRWRSRAAEAMG